MRLKVAVYGRSQSTDHIEGMLDCNAGYFISQGPRIYTCMEALYPSNLVLMRAGSCLIDATRPVAQNADRRMRRNVTIIAGRPDGFWMHGADRSKLVSGEASPSGFCPNRLNIC
jgi:hypothetical protein